jgi:hypothetical protein
VVLLVGIARLNDSATVLRCRCLTGIPFILAVDALSQEFSMTMQIRFTTLLLPLIAFFGVTAHSAETVAVPVEVGTSKAIVIVPVISGTAEDVQGSIEPNSPDEMDQPRAQRKTPEPRDPTRGMYDPHTEREGDSRTLDQLSRDRLNLDGKRSRSLDDLSSPLRERRRIDQSRGRLREPEERTYGTSSLQNRLSVPDARRNYRIESSRDLRQEYIEENGSADYRVYRTR